MIPYTIIKRILSILLFMLGHYLASAQAVTWSRTIGGDAFNIKIKDVKIISEDEIWMAGLFHGTFNLNEGLEVTPVFIQSTPEPPSPIYTSIFFARFNAEGVCQSAFVVPHVQDQFEMQVALLRKTQEGRLYVRYWQGGEIDIDPSIAEVWMNIGGIPGGRANVVEYSTDGTLINYHTSAMVGDHIKQVVADENMFIVNTVDEWGRPGGS
jgi:hypothetical protein